MGEQCLQIPWGSVCFRLDAYFYPWRLPLNFYQTFPIDTHFLFVIVLSLESKSPKNSCFSPSKINSSLLSCFGFYLVGLLFLVWLGFTATEPKRKRATVHWACLCISELPPSLCCPNTLTTSSCRLHGLCVSWSKWVVYVFIFFPKVKNKRWFQRQVYNVIVLCEKQNHLIFLIVTLIKDVNIQLIWNTQWASQLSEIMWIK